MISWDRCGKSTFIGVLSRYEVQVLRSYVDGLVSLIDYHFRSVHTVETPHEQEPAEEHDLDPRIAAILRSEVGQHEPDWVLAFAADLCLREASHQASLMASTLPGSSGVVCLKDHAEAVAWLKCIRLVRITITVVAGDRGEIRGQLCGPTLAWLSDMSAALESVMDSVIDSPLVD